MSRSSPRSGGDVNRRRKLVPISVIACVAVFLASASWFIPLMLVVMLLVLGGGIYVRRWWFPLVQGLPLAFFVPAMFYSIHASIGSEPGLALMMSGVANVFYVCLAIAGCLIGWIVAVARRSRSS
jgi:energy-coupling factor transporter transmembrane protein EcfT